MNRKTKGNLLEGERDPIDPDLLVTAADSGNSGNNWTYTPHRTDWGGDTLSNRESALLDPTNYHYETSTTFDALNRPKKITYPEDDLGQRKDLIPTYNRAGALESAELGPSGDLTTYVDRIAYNARGQRLFVALGNGVMTRYSYDPDTFRLRRMRSREYTKTGTTYSETGTKFQDSGYAYDLSGNIIGVLDRSDIGTKIPNTDSSTELDGYPHAIPTTNTFLRRYEYDSLARLTSAMGACYDQREVFNDPWKNYTGYVQDLNTVRDFTEEFTYDANSNLTQKKHIWDSTTKHTRGYSMVSGTNRLESMSIDSGPGGGFVGWTYDFDAVGNLTQENLDRKSTWDHADRMRTWRNQPDGSEASVYAQYLYDAAGQRVMKVVSKSGTDDVTIYVDGVFEHREHLDPVGGDIVNDELHVMADDERVARLRVGTAFSGDNSPDTIYVLNDYLGSSTFTLQSDGSFFSREEYTPYGESSYGSYDRKRYRFTGKEKDEESGLHYHGARYYAPWLGRWNSADPAGMVDGPNVYSYARGNPVGINDPSGTQGNRASGTSDSDGWDVHHTPEGAGKTQQPPTESDYARMDEWWARPESVPPEAKPVYEGDALISWVYRDPTGADPTEVWSPGGEHVGTIKASGEVERAAIQLDDILGLGIGTLAVQGGKAVFRWGAKRLAKDSGEFFSYTLMDTNVLIALQKGDARAIEFASRNAGELAISPAAQSEFLKGASLEELAALTKKHDIAWVMDAASPDEVASLMKQLGVSSRRHIPDMTILATAHKKGFGLVAGDTKLFGRALESGMPLPRYRNFTAYETEMLKSYVRMRKRVRDAGRLDSPHRYTGSPVGR